MDIKFQTKKDLVNIALELKEPAIKRGYDYPVDHNTYEDFLYLSHYELRKFIYELKTYIKDGYTEEELQYIQR